MICDTWLSVKTVVDLAKEFPAAMKAPPPHEQGLPRVHFSTQSEHCLGDTMGGFTEKNGSG